MEEKLDLIIQKLDTITERLDKALALVETARDLLISFLKNPKNDSENPFDWNMSHGGFSVEVLEVDENNEITAASLSWSPLSGEGWLNIPTHRIDQD